MPITTFDTLKYVRRLEQAGVPPAQAEAQADVLNEVFAVNLESLLTKGFFESRMNSGFAKQDASIDRRFAEQNAYIDKRFAEQNACMNTRFAQLEAKIDGNFRIFLWTQAVVLSAVVFPYLERLAGI